MSTQTESYRGVFDENGEPRVRIENASGIGYQTKIYIDDQDVSGCFNSVTITCDLNGTAHATLHATAVEIAAGGEMLQLELPDERTAALLVKYGWTPPAQPVLVEYERRHSVVTPPLEHELFTPGERVSGRELMDRFIERLRSEWAPDENASLTVARVRTDDGEIVAGKRAYTLEVVLDAPSPEYPCTCGHPHAEHLWGRETDPQGCEHYYACTCTQYSADATAVTHENGAGEESSPPAPDSTLF